VSSVSELECDAESDADDDRKNPIPRPLFERLGKLFGSSALATTAIVILTSIVFGLEHLHEQGLAGAEQATIVGLVYGTIFAKTRQIWMLMIAHAAFDIAAVAIIYWNVESDVAHLFFR
jgi:membrane protease YdiL (CAAX protease family)